MVKIVQAILKKIPNYLNFYYLFNFLTSLPLLPVLCRFKSKSLFSYYLKRKKINFIKNYILIVQT